MPVELHLAKDMDALNTIAGGAGALSYKSATLQVLYKVARSIYKQVTQNGHDDELAYVYAYRFLKLLEIIYMRDSDQRFVHMQFDTMRKHVSEIYSALQVSLPKRYDLLNAATCKDKKSESTDSTAKVPSEIFGKDNFITSRQLYAALQKLSSEMLIIDIRSNANYTNSRLSGNYNIINIDEILIEKGMSAGKLEERLLQNIKDVFMKREQFAYIVLMDNDTTRDFFQGSKLKLLYDMLTIWDVNKKYERLPYVLDGGYVDFVDVYPTLSTNPRVTCMHRYADLDDLLNLDGIEYPALSDRDENLILSETVIADQAAVKESIEKLYKALLQHTERAKKVEEQLFYKDYELLKMMVAREKTEYDINEQDQMGYEREAISAERDAIHERKQTMKQEFLTALSKQNFKEAEYVNRPELVLLEKGIVDWSRKRRKLMEEMRRLEADEYEKMDTSTPVIDKPEPLGKKPAILKQPISGDNVYSKIVPSPDMIKKIIMPDIPKKVPPTVNRANKPLKPISIDSGLNGLVNIRNTCYMNSILQCLRHIPYFRYFFVSGEYKSHITAIRPRIVMPLGELMQSFWVGTNRSIRPQQFYTKIIRVHPTFGKGCHEDANEFFMITLSSLHEDIQTEVRMDRRWAEQRVAFYHAVNQKESFIIDQFYFQIRTDCTCPKCKKKILKFDTESLLIITPPVNKRARLEDLADDALYTSDKRDAVYCPECEILPDITRKISVQPKILTIMLKRYECVERYYANKTGSFRKTETRCSFPLEDFKVGYSRYKLWGLCLHRGELHAGHYVAICRNVLDQKWYEYSDEVVRPFDITTPAVEYEVYMFFYQTVDEKLTRFL